MSEQGAPATTGGAGTGTQSPVSSSPSPPSPGPSSSRSGRAEGSGILLSWATFAVIGYVWLFTSKYDSAPWWGPTVALVINALPGGMIVEIVKTVVVVVVERLPLRRDAAK